MPKKLKSTVIVSSILSVTILISSCYLNPASINLYQYKKVSTELISKQKQVDSLFKSENNSKERHIDLQKLKTSDGTVFSETYQLLQSKGAIEIIYYSPDCIYFILKKHDNIFNDKFECLESGNSSNCLFSEESCNQIEKQRDLEKGWKYLIIRQYLCE